MVVERMYSQGSPVHDDMGDVDDVTGMSRMTRAMRARNEVGCHYVVAALRHFIM